MEQSIVVTHVTAAGLAVGVLQWLKNSKYFPWITQERGKLLRVLALVTSALAAAGIHYTWNAVSRELIFQIPTISGIFAFLVGWFKTFIFQEVTYQATAKNNVGDLLRQILAAVTPTAPTK